MRSFSFERNHRRLTERWAQNSNEQLLPSNPSRVQIRILPPDNVANSTHDHHLIQRDLPEANFNPYDASHSWIPSAWQQYPVTILIVLAIGVAHVFRRHRPPLTYRALVEHKQWFRWWIAICLISLPDDAMPQRTSTHRDHGFSSYSQWMMDGRRLQMMVRHRPRDIIGRIGEFLQSVEY
jgi:hypothetical protein